ncbi:MAG TPA: SdrD B-like domain-containing protein [Vicinamibacterales bacterium]|nr:SdrD B-like domain-containing protein [Vicinamibacterales bacterium]
MLRTDVVRNRTKITVLVAGLACCAAAIKADGPGHSFTSLTSPFTQELYGVTADPVVVDGNDAFIGGVAFTPQGDVWAAECFGYQYHRFDRQGRVSDGHGGTVHQESLVDGSPLGCGVVNHPAFYNGVSTIFANTLTGLWPINAENGIPTLGGPINSEFANAGNGRGIDVDPTNEQIVYTAASCSPALGESATCTLWAFSLTSANTSRFARFNRAQDESIESLYFTPTGSHVVASYRDTVAGTQGLLVIARRATPLTGGTIDNAQVVRRIAMSSMPQGVAFRAAGDFAVTLNEDGTMTRLAFPAGDFTAEPTQSVFASGGFLGGLLRVGADGCVYAPQGRMAGGSSGVRYSDDAVAPNDSVVRICGGFVPAPGVADAEWSPEPGSISGSAFADWNRNGVRDAAEPGLSGVQISMSGAATGSAVTGSNGGYTLTDVLSGLYSVGAPVAVGSLSGNPTPLAVDLGSGEHRTGVDFPYTESTQPVCTVSAPSGSPTRVNLTLRDGSGVRRIVVRAVANFQVAIGGGTPVTAPATVDLPTPATGDLSVTATRSNAAQAASVQLDVVDVFGNQVSCASSVPASTTPDPQPPPTPKPPVPGDDQVIKRELSGRGRLDIEIVKVSGNMRYVTIRNDRKGLESVEVWVNHRWFLSGRLKDGQVKTLDVSRALVPGKKNRIVLVGRGQRYDSAVVTISAQP